MLPGHPRIMIGMGAAHAAKFASLMGKILADLAIDGRTTYPIDAFRANRPALTDPAFTPVFRLHGS
jgi:sarcosine oxidase